MDEGLVEITVDGVSYGLDDLGEKAREQVRNLRYVDSQIADLTAQLAVYRTARNAYDAALRELLPRTHQ